ncbi:uncharacterized protein CIMG_00281 [Coccidioides immitis RS]|uniref:Uncharacterized protein n=2 Tax=Coccidioides immitis TaxID=5501 RepID=J3KGN9_COCIM|nr:uncharacterized protein CIMG_00281 [Coccidioides immitis RS]EAS34927.3 hypothetical protein CIMG_00281 [Coccidioides immitis RS]KMP00121.1 hypothetical protein CIRG_00263 [Coccidioides immitis RMSCC 2394]
MPRTLPWQVKSESRRSATPASSASRTSARASRPATDSEKDHAPPRAKRARRDNRSPSTSPAREPPPEELMLEGLENDEVYIMVEDEFLATAQAFTRHLHYAEYARRKKEAKLANEGNLAGISRRTDGKSTLSNETKKKIEAEVAAEKRRVALDELRNAAGRPLVDSEAEDVDVSEGDKDDDPWVGTHLQPLMAAPKPSRSLVGLHGIKSATKAALGCRRPISGRVQKRSPAVNLAARGQARNFQEQEISSEDDDSLDMSDKTRPRSAVTSHKSSAAPSRPTTKTVSRLPPVPLTRDPNVLPRVMKASTEPGPSHRPGTAFPHPRSSTISRLRIHQPIKTPQPSKHKSSISKLLDEFDELDESTTPITEDDPSRSVSKAKPAQDSRFEKRRDGVDRLREQRLREVPTFL